MTDSQFVTAMNVFWLLILDELGDTSWEVVLFTKTANGKAIGQLLSFNHPITKSLKETKHHITQVLANSSECRRDFSGQHLLR